MTRRTLTTLVVLVVSLGCKISQGPDRSTSISINPESPSKLVTQSSPLVPRAFSVGARNLYATQFIVASSARVSGTFRASGGSGNDIQVFILDGDNYRLLEAGEQFHGYYSSGKISSGSIDVRLPKGSYYIVFNNKFSFLTNKAVDAEINLEQ